eukprot:jgi/Bigna1/88960/estExt_fgenesh1_pg.C_410072
METKNVFAPSIKGLFILDEDGKRIYAKYWTGDCKATGTTKLQKEFELRVAKKTMGMANMADTDAISFEKYVLVFKRLGDNTVLYVLGDPDENELMLATVLNAYEESVSQLLRGQLDANSMLQGLAEGQLIQMSGYASEMLFATRDRFAIYSAEVCLCADEIVMDGLIMETDSLLIAGRASMAQTIKEIPIQDQTLQQFASSAKEKLSNFLR